MKRVPGKLKDSSEWRQTTTVGRWCFFHISRDEYQLTLFPFVFVTIKVTANVTMGNAFLGLKTSMATNNSFANAKRGIQGSTVRKVKNKSDMMATKKHSRAVMAIV